MRTLALRSCLLALLFVSAGCRSLPPLSSFQSEHGFVVYGPITEEQAKELDRILRRLPSKMAHSIRGVALRPPAHFSGGVVAHFNGPTCGPTICFQENNINVPSTAWHEAAHAYQNYLDYDCELYNEDFSDAWERVAGDVYSREGYKKDRESEYPRIGILESYGRRNCHEDQATWVEHVYLFLTKHASAITALRGEEFNSDPRYAQKLHLLHKYGFLDDWDYRRVLDYLK